ncbi:MAG: 2-oxoglutarate dehydrogenase E1 component [Cytophagales bacterium]|nr:2-oxoglutarate dehydrogenase E1 component [Cytophagales bacterium]
MDQFSYIANADTVVIDELYKSYRQNPQNVDVTWQKFFEGFDFSIAKYGDNGGSKATTADATIDHKEVLVYRMIRGYRTRGHLKAKTNPVRERKDRANYTGLQDYGLTEADLDKKFKVGKEIGLENATLREIIAKLNIIYEGSFGFEYMYIRQPDIMNWLQIEFEKAAQAYNPPIEIKKRMLQKLNEAVVFENFLHTKFVGQKRFSLEGGENTIVAIDTIINAGSVFGIEEVVIGMAHRGRLNVLCNIMGKTYEQLFKEFEGNYDVNDEMGAGDVKYHMGYSSETTTIFGKNVYLKLMPNPSHLEAVDPIVLGYTRAQVVDEYKGDFKKCVPVIIHGDAAIAGQGVVYETVQMSKLPSYQTGGTIHFVINNQIGFTTDFEDARSGIYCTDVAKIIDAPVIHVNGDDVEAVAFAAKTAIDYRQQFASDIFIDMVCYRRYGHNESDEPRFTQPTLYNIIAKHPNAREAYKTILIERGELDAKQIDEMDAQFRTLLQERLEMIKQKEIPYQPSKLELEWNHLRKATPADFEKSPESGISKKNIEKLKKALLTLPPNFKPLKQIENLLKERQKFFDNNQITWAMAELMSYGSLLMDKHITRMSGQDVKRGTFSHRHAYFFDSETNAPYCQIDNIENDQEKFRIFNSHLSEFGALGFEYGFAMATPNALVIWEAQFGDFVNGAQTIIDQFISSAETKWQRMNGLVMLLPHGYEGQGPEHSSARPERFLQLAADYNMVICNITLPSNLFHMFRRQLKWEFRKPCILMTPKSLLRHPKVVSSIDDIAEGTRFIEIIDDNWVQAKEVKKVLLCTGKVYFDLLEEQQNKSRKDIAIVRLEQLYPLAEKQLDKILASYKGAKVAWVQEEPVNMGYWDYITRIYPKVDMDVVARKANSSPATGYNKVHVKEQAELVKRAFEL